MTTPERKAVTVTEFMKATGLSRATIYRLIDQGDLRAVRFGSSQYLIPLSELAKFD